MIPLTGYADRWSVAPDESIAFKISSTAAQPYEATLVKIICGDPNPAGPGIKIQPLSASLNGTYPSRVQPVNLGSYAAIQTGDLSRAQNDVLVVAGPNGHLQRLREQRRLRH